MGNPFKYGYVVSGDHFCNGPKAALPFRLGETRLFKVEG